MSRFSIQGHFIRLLSLVMVLWLAVPALACTNFIASPGAMADGSTVITYTCDGEFHPILRRLPAEDHEPGAMQELKHWNGQVLGEVAYPAHTYAVVNLMNEHQVVIGETTTGGREELIDSDGMLHYWHLMRMTLQRAKTAREAVKTMGRLTAEYGYRSSGESFAIGDPQEAWIMEMVGPGADGHGAHWVALRVPDGHVSAYANHGRIGTFPLDDPDNCLYSPDMIAFATARGWYDPDSGPFSWRDAFFPATAQDLRYTATRVWSLFRRCAPSQDWSSDYHRGVADAEPYPLWIEPEAKLTTHDVFALMRDHYEGTEIDMTQGIAAGPYGHPYRWRPMGFEVEGRQYTWERPISTQQTGFSMICQSRAWLPDAIGGVTWYGVDDTWFTCYVPLYCGITEIPESYATGRLSKFSWDSAWWVFNFVSNYAGLKYSYMVQDIQTVQARLESDLLTLQPTVETTATELMEDDPDLAIRYLTDYSVQNAESVARRWRQLGEHLLTRYNDGYVKDEDGRVQEHGYSDSWLETVLEQRPDQYRLPEDEQTDLQEPADY